MLSGLSQAGTIKLNGFLDVYLSRIYLTAFSIFGPSQVPSANAVSCYPRDFVGLITVPSDSIYEIAQAFTDRYSN